MAAKIKVENTLLTVVRNYLLDILGSDAIGGDIGDSWVNPWPEAGQLPFYLQSSYTYYRVELFGRPCLLMLALTPEGQTPAVARKHQQTVSKQFNGAVIYVIEVVNSYNRKRLIEQRVPFLVPGNQLYLPALGVDLREYFKTGKPTELSHLGAPAQVVILREILLQDCSGLPAKELAQRLGYTPMTISRAINELSGRQLAEPEKVGKEKHLHFVSSGQNLWEAALPALQNPVNKRAWIVWNDKKQRKVEFQGSLAGESALAHYTSLANTGIKQWAIAPTAWSNLAKQADVTVLANQVSEMSGQYRTERDVTEIEVWAYNPLAILSGKSWVDPLSLWLSLAANTDERIEIARETLLEQVWNTKSW